MLRHDRTRGPAPPDSNSPGSLSCGCTSGRCSAIRRATNSNPSIRSASMQTCLSADVEPSAFPSLDELRATAERLRGRVLETPVWRWQTGAVERQLAPASEVWLKLELLQ